jgi:hypothetical protein
MRSLGRDFDRWLLEGLIARRSNGEVELRRGARIFLVSLASLTSSSEGMKEMRLALADMAVYLNCDYIKSKQTNAIETIERWHQHWIWAQK